MIRDERHSDNYYLVNQILAEWNPIGVPEGIADNEYTKYVPNILRFKNDYDGLVSEMKRIMNDVIGLSFDEYDDDFKQNTLLFAKRIIDTLRNNEIITADELYSAIEKDKLDSKFKSNGELLLSAISDYPTLNLKEQNDFLNELKNEVGVPLTYQKLNEFEKKLSFDNGENVWRKESLSSVLAMYNEDKSKTLDDIVKNISRHYRSNSED